MTVAVMTVLGIALVTWMEYDGGGPPVRGFQWMELAVSLAAYGFTGAVLIDRRPDLPFGWLLAGTSIIQTVAVAIIFPAATAISAGSTSTLARWGIACSGLMFAPTAVQGLVNVRFPSGKPSGRWGRFLNRVIIAGTLLAVAGGLFGATNLADVVPDASGVTHPLTGGTTVGKVFDALALAPPFVVLAGLFAGLGVVARFRRAEGLERQQLKWRATGVLAELSLFPLAVSGHLVFLDSIGNLMFTLTLVVPVLRYRLWAIDNILRRSAVYSLATVTVVVLYVGLAIAANRVASERIGASVAAAIVAVGFNPIRSRAQNLVDRFAYGNRSDPYRTISELDRRLVDVALPGQVLPALVDGIVESLRLPYAAVVQPDDTVMSSRGAPGKSVERWPLGYEGSVVGHLLASPRWGEDEFDERDRSLLGDVARHAGAAVHAERLTSDLLASRQRLVAAREEERRRLRRDLHDGLGPVLTAIGLNLDAARAQLSTDPATAATYLTNAREATTQAIDDVRRVVYDLRPPALDNHGLVDAVRLHVERLRTDNRCCIEVEAHDLPPLPAAVELAAYRTALEGITNAIRHGGADNCVVRIRHDGDHLTIDVTDDGRSTAPWTPGVGLLSVKERAEELGGSTIAGSGPNGGGHLSARLPLGVPIEDVTA